MMCRVSLLLFGLVAFWGTGPGRAADSDGWLRWHRAERRVDADIHGWPLDDTLQRIARDTGWKVFMEPGLETRVSARFERRPEREALAALLSDLNFVLIPASNAPSRLLVFKSVSSRATVAVQPEEVAAVPATNLLANELVVRLKRGSGVDIHALAARLGGRVAGILGSLDAYRLTFETAEAADAARKALESETGIAAIESNYSIERPTQPDSLKDVVPPALGLKARPVTDGSSVIVALLDTGIPSSGVQHADFLLPGVNVAGGAGDDSAGITHGPAMFETILQGLSVTQNGEDGTPIRVLPVDIYGGRGETSTFELAQGIVTALEHGADIINLSLSGPTPSPVLQDILRQAAAAGVLTFAAPGNEPTTAPTFPAAYPEVIAVTASDARGSIADYANRGGFIDLIAPGTSFVPFAGETWVVHGTSVATAYAAGLAAGLVADSGRPLSEIVGLMRERLGFQPGSQVPAGP